MDNMNTPELSMPDISGSLLPDSQNEDDENDGGSPPGMCPFCSQQLPEHVDIQDHLKETHQDQIAFPCQLCWRVYISKEEYNRHEQLCIQGN